MCLICDTIGIHEIILRPDGPKLKDWIDGDEDEDRHQSGTKLERTSHSILEAQSNLPHLEELPRLYFREITKTKSKFLFQNIFLVKTPA